MKKFLLIILLSISNIAISGNDDIVKLLNSGRGIDALRILEAEVADTSGNAKLAASYSLADACMLLDDESCLAKIYSASWKDMDQNLKRYDSKDKSQIDTWRLIFDANSTYFYFAAFNSLDEKNFGVALSHEESGFQGSPYSAHAGLKLVGKAAIAAYVGKQAYAEQQMRRARALILNKDPGTLQAQTNLAFLHETSLFYLNDSRDIKRWFEANTAVFNETGKDASNYLNPYIYQRLALVLYNSGILDGKKRAMLAEDIHARFQLLQMAEESRLYRKKEEFYAFLAFGDPSNKLGLSFNSTHELNKLKSTSFGSMGVKAYLSIESGSPNMKELSGLLKNFNDNYKKLGTATQVNLAPTKAILESLIAKAENNSKKEVEFLELYIDSILDFYGSKGYRVGDNNPIQTNPAITLQWYVLNRLGKLKPSSEKRINLGLLMLQSINSSQFGDEESSYSILSKAKNDMEVEQALNFITIKERYGNYVSRSYKDSADALIKNQSISRPEEKLVVRAETSSFLLDMFTKSNEQLQDIRAEKNDSFVVNYRDISKRLANDELAILSASNDQLTIVTIISKNSATLRIIDGQDSAISSVKKLLISNDLFHKSREEIKDSSLKISKEIFNGINLSGIKKIYLVNGPTISGIPYTLLSNPVGGWLISDFSVRAFHAAPQFFTNSPNIDNYRPTFSYVGFANPILRSDDEISSVKNIANLIRGSSSRKLTSLPELPETEIEVREFAKSLGGNSVIYSGNKATVENLFQTNLNEVEVLGFATHGVMVGEADGVDSPSLVLTPHNDSGLVTSEILFSLHGAPKVAILSTCNSKTVSSSLDQSEITSLSSSFSLKGTKSVISSYWAVNSDGTSMLMTTMAKYIGRGFSYAESLNKSQRDLMASKSFSHPAIWAAFVGVGDYSAKMALHLNGEKKSFSNFLIDSAVTQADRVLVTNFKISDVSPIVVELDSKLGVKSSDYFSFLKPQSIKAYQYDGATYFGVHDGLNYTIFRNAVIGIKPNKLCEFPVSNDWYAKKFITSNQISYVLFARSREGINEPAIASINLNSCEVKTNILSSASYSNDEDISIQPLKSNEKFLLYSLRKIKDPVKYSAYTDELNFPRNCSFQNKLEYYVVNSNLSVINSGKELNLRIPENANNNREWVHAVYTNECTFENQPKKISTSWFEEKYLFHDDVGALVRPGLTDEEKLIGRNFTQVMSWSSGLGGDLIYIDGSPGLTSILFASRAKIALSDRAKQAAINSEYSQYVYQISKKRWLRVGSSSECSTVYPLAFDREILFACNKFESQSPEKSSSFIYKAKLH